MEQTITFDEFYTIRILDPQKFKQSEKLAEDCKGFVEKIQQFNEIVKNISGAVGTQADRIEREKMKAIGLRNKVNSEAENRKKRVAEIQLQVAEKQAELDRLQAQMDSLTRVEGEQYILLEKLRNSEL